MTSERDKPDDTPHESINWGYKSQFRIFALGKNFDVEAYLETASAPIQFDDIWHIDPPTYLNSGIEKALGGDRLTIDVQERIACVFLEENMRELTELSRFPGVDSVNLALYYRVELWLGWTFLVVPPPKLMSLTLKAGVQPNYYVQPVPLSSQAPYFG
jgi:hypothetical protein